jgi:rSAM/selenodomain-associated transferase 1
LNTLIIFIRPPVPGKVKTRLAATVGDAEALRIYGWLLSRTCHEALGVEAERRLFYSEPPSGADHWPEPAFRKSLQRGADLGDRMHNAFAEVFAGGAAKAVVIGSDCPELNSALIEQAFVALDRCDFVLGPTPDGGYYLLGMHQPEPTVFRDVAWSTETVFRQTVEQIERLGKTVHFLPELSDVDTEADWRAFQQRMRNSQPPLM